MEIVKRLGQSLRRSATKSSFMRNTKRTSATAYISQGSPMCKNHNKALHSDKFFVALQICPRVQRYVSTNIMDMTHNEFMQQC